MDSNIPTILKHSMNMLRVLVEIQNRDTRRHKTQSVYQLNHL